MSEKNPDFPAFRGWGTGSAAFSYGLKDRGMIIGYIMRQKEHHKQKSFEEEYRTFLEENGITIDERYFLRED